MERSDKNLIRTAFEGKSRILRDVGWLQPLSSPQGGKPLCRDGYAEILASYVGEALRTGTERNIFVYGKPGTGKTLLVRHVLDEAKKYVVERGLEVIIVYVNAGQTRSPCYTMVEVVRGIGASVPEGGWQMFRLRGREVPESRPSTSETLLRQRPPSTG